MADPASETSGRSIPGWLTPNSTPDMLRLMALVTVVVLLGAGVVAWVLTARLVDQTNEVSARTGEVLIATQQVSASFAEADAAAVSVHLAGAEGNREQRRLFEQAMDRATASLEEVARLVGDDEASHDALQDIAAETTDYAGLIEAARLASVQEINGADITLRQASLVNRSEISPDVQLIADRARGRFDDQTSTTWYVVALLLLAAALLVLLGAQWVLRRRFRRLINVPLALASLIVLVLIIVGGRSFVGQQQAFNNAESQAFDAIQVSEEIQQTAYRHRASSTTAVLAGQTASDIDELELALAAAGGPLDQAVTTSSSDRERAGAQEVRVRWERYLSANDASQAAMAAGDIETAEALTQGAANSAFNGFNTAVEAALLDNREQFLGELQAASDSLRWLRELIVVGSLIAAVLAWWGFAQRIGEYR